MKKLLSTLFLALVASVGTTFAARDVVPSDAVLKNYYKTGQLCVCIFVPAEMACNDVVFVGTYNRDASGAWITDVKTLAKFEPVEGYDGWYVIAVNDETPADFQDKGIQGKPVVLDRDGNFNWAYQVGEVTVIRGGVTVVDGYVGEIDLVGYTKDVPNVFTIDALKANANPCTAVYHDYTFTVISDGCEGFAVPYLVGSMTDWGFQQMQVNVEKTQELGAPVYYYKCRCAEGTRYQVLSGLKAADGAIIEQPTWDNDSYLLQLVDDVWVRYTENGNVDLTTGANVNITFDVRQKNLRWARCADIAEGTGTGEASADVVFTAVDFAGQGVSGTGGAVSATKDGVTFTCDKGFGYQYAVRCYKDGVVNITSATEQIGKIEFDFDTVSGKLYDGGGMDPEVVVNAKEWTVTAAAQIRFKKISIYFGTAEAVKIDTITVAEALVIGEALADNSYSDKKYAVVGYVAKAKAFGEKYEGTQTFYMSDDATATDGDFTAYNCNVAAPGVVPGNYVAVVGKIQKYVGTSGTPTIEITDGEVEILSAPAEGICGANLTWEFDTETGVLTISGTGAMADYPSATMPWHDYRSSIKTVAISDGVTSIGILAFYGCTSLTSIAIPNSVTSIGDGAFYDCSSLTSVTIPISVTSIGFQAFSTCSSLTSITIPNSVTSIGYGTFQDCTSLTSVTIGNSVTSIGEWAFASCKSLTSITISNSVTSIGEDAFNGCSKLTSVTFEGLTPPEIGSGILYATNNNYSIHVPCGAKEAYLTALNVNNTIVESRVKEPVIASGTCGDNLTWELSCNSVLTISGTGVMADYAYNTMPWYDYRSSILSVVISDGVTSIGLDAFYNCSKLTSITIPNSVISIGEDAFYNCSSLTSITIPNSVTSIGDYAFRYCSSLTSVTIPNSVTSIGNSAFYGCTRLKSLTIGNSVTSIGDYAFRGCTSLTSITIPNSVTSIGYRAFYDCDSLTSINVDANNSNYSSADGVLFNKDKTTLVVYPGGKQGAYTIPNSVTSIERSAFYGCKSLTSIAIPNSLTSIGDVAFRGCSSLTSVTIPNSVTSIGDDAFWQCKSLTSINVDSNNPNYSSVDGVLFNKDKTRLIQYPRGNTRSEYTIPNSVTSIIGYAFDHCTSLTSVTIGNSVKRIGVAAFYDCSSLTSITIPNSVTSIENQAFYGCKSLTSVTIGNSVKSIGDEAFRGYSSLKSLHCKALTPPEVLTSSFGTDAYDNVTLHVPFESIADYKADRIWGTFKNIQYIDTFYNDEICYKYITQENVLSQSLKNEANFNLFTKISLVGSQTWHYDSQYGAKMSGFQNDVTHKNEDWLISPTMDLSQYSSATLDFVHTFGPKASLPTTAVQKAQYTCWISNNFDGDVTTATWTELPITYNTSAWSFITTTVDIPAENLKENCHIAWKYVCENSAATWEIASVTISGNFLQPNVKVIAKSSKYSNDIIIPSIATNNNVEYTVTTIAASAFSDCPSLTSITIPNSVTSIGSYAFNGCTSLKSITIPNSITSLYNNTFANCTSLNEIILPASIISIGENVFAGCTKLYDVYCYAMEPPTAYESSFANYNAFLHVPCECQRVYLLDVLFGNFKYIECISSDNTTTDEIVVTPSENEANVIWPSVNGAASYELVIKDKDGNIVCTLIFNANGQLTSIAFNAPSRNGVPAQTQSAGFSFTVTGLDSGTGYDLTLTAKDNSGNAIQTETISFVTTGGNVSTDIDQLQGHKVQSTKVIKDGQVLILRNGKTYTMQGQEVK